MNNLFSNDPALLHQVMAETMDKIIKEIRDIQNDARKNGNLKRPIVSMQDINAPNA